MSNHNTLFFKFIIWSIVCFQLSSQFLKAACLHFPFIHYLKIKHNTHPDEEIRYFECFVCIYCTVYLEIPYGTLCIMRYHRSIHCFSVYFILVFMNYTYCTQFRYILHVFNRIQYIKMLIKQCYK